MLPTLHILAQVWTCIRERKIKKLKSAEGSESYRVASSLWESDEFSHRPCLFIQSSWHKENTNYHNTYGCGGITWLRALLQEFDYALSLFQHTMFSQPHLLNISHVMFRTRTFAIHIISNTLDYKKKYNTARSKPSILTFKTNYWPSIIFRFT